MNFISITVYILLALSLAVGLKIAPRRAFNQDSLSLDSMTCLKGVMALFVLFHHLSQKKLFHQTGTIGLFELSRGWIIAKEAGIPALLGVAVLISAYTARPLARVLIYNDALLDTQKVGAALEERGNSQKFAAALKTSTILVSASFFASGAIQFFLARMIYTEGASPEEFNAQVGRMTWISYLAVLLPCMLITCAAFVKIANAIKTLAGLDFEEALAPELREGKK